MVWSWLADPLLPTTMDDEEEHGAARRGVAVSLVDGPISLIGSLPSSPSFTTPPPSQRRRWRRPSEAAVAVEEARYLSLSLSPEDPSSSSPSTLHPLFTVSAVADELAVAQVWARLTERIGSRKRVGS